MKLNIKLQMTYLQKDNWAFLLKCWRVINSYKFLHVTCVGMCKSDRMPFIDRLVVC